MEKHINVVAAFQIGYSIFRIVIGTVAFVALQFFGVFADVQELENIFPLIANIVIVTIVVFSVPGIVAGVGLIRRKEWARVLTLIVSALELLSFPLGTAVGVYSIWALTQPENASLLNQHAG